MSTTSCALWVTAQIDQPLFTKGLPFPESRLAGVKVYQSGYVAHIPWSRADGQRADRAAPFSSWFVCCRAKQKLPWKSALMMLMWPTKKDSYMQRYFGRCHKSKKITIHKRKMLMHTNQRCCNYTLRYLASEGQQNIGWCSHALYTQTFPSISWIDIFCTASLSKEYGSILKIHP